MKKLILFFLLTIGYTAYSQQAITTFILTRHAEKGDDGSKDPDLTTAGNERAQLLVKILKETNVDAIYATAYKRTRNTVAPLAQAKGLTLEGYEAFKTDEIDLMLKKYAGGTIVISGHSNNIPWIVNYLIGKEQYQSFDDTRYDNLIVVSVLEKGKSAKVTWLSY